MTRPANQMAMRANRSYFRPTPLELKALGFFFPDYGVKIAALIRIPEVSMRLSPLARTFLAAAGLAIIAPAAAALAQQQPPGTPKSTHGAWSVICDKPAGASEEQCALMQNVIADDRPEVGLSVVILKTADRKSRILRILAPLGVLLKDGMELYIDNNNIGRAYFTRCFSEGCYVEVDIDDELLKVLRAGKNAVFALRESVDQDRVGIPIELSGFAEGYDALP
ncbi:Invasion protein B [Agrobacterium tumefaciens]|nr:Invasion protein B [Agrobacterium tumefaciens]